MMPTLNSNDLKLNSILVKIVEKSLNWKLQVSNTFKKSNAAIKIIECSIDLKEQQELVLVSSQLQTTISLWEMMF